MHRSLAVSHRHLLSASHCAFVAAVGYVFEQYFSLHITGLPFRSYVHPTSVAQQFSVRYLAHLWISQVSELVHTHVASATHAACVWLSGLVHVFWTHLGSLVHTAFHSQSASATHDVSFA
eukprot:TRINITY_DN3475_c0_g1_i8.p2 TRINITY_DN3475_c0_g1~~TRINITY_DN3475_c0_g1_i8.p2  ORF type:complete len:120 (-),score=17.06 TRINITY_DN3475_c0_g1_i8:51-410(-)